MSQYFVKESGTPLANIETMTGNSGGAVGPDGAGNINAIGSGSITIAGNAGANTLTTQLTGLTNHSLLVGAGTPTITNLGVATNGQIPIGSTGADPVLATITGIDNVTVSNAAGSITLSQTNFYSTTGSTVGATNFDLTLPLGAVASTWTFVTNISAFESTTPAGAGFQIIGTGRTTGAAATLIGGTFTVSWAQTDGALAAATVTMLASLNNIIVRMTGVAGLTVDWSAQGTSVRAT